MTGQLTGLMSEDVTIKISSNDRCSDVLLLCNSQVGKDGIGGLVTQHNTINWAQSFYAFPWQKAFMVTKNTTNTKRQAKPIARCCCNGRFRNFYHPNAPVCVSITYIIYI